MNPTLTIDFIANVARITQDMAQINRVVTGSMAGVNSAVATAKRAIEALGVTLSLGAIVLFADRTLNAIARMKDLGQEAGTTASAMSKFEGPARKAGESLDAVATAMFRMSKAALEAKDPSSASAQALAAIGISTAQLKGLKPDEMFELIARSLEKYGDGLAKNNVMQQLFGKSGKELNGVMHSIAEQAQLTATVTDEQAEAAKRLEEQMVELKMTGDKFWRSLISDAVPALTEFVKKLAEIQQGMGFWKTGLLGIASIFGVDLTQSLGTAPDKILAIKNQIIDLNHAIAEQRAVLGANADGVIKRYTDQIAGLQAQLDKLQPSASSTPFAGSTASAGGGGRPDPRFDPAAIAAAKAADEAYKGINAQLDKEIANLKGVGEVQAFIEKLDEDRYAKIDPKRKQELIDKETLYVRLKNEAAARGELLKSDLALIEAMQKMHDLEQSALDASRDQTQQMQFDVTLIGKTAEEVEKLTALRQIDLEVAKQVAQITTEDDSDMSVAQANEIERIRAIGEARKKSVGDLIDQSAAAKNSLSFWTDLGDRAGQFFSDLVLHGKSAFGNLREMVKQLFADMIKLFVQRWVLNMAAGGTFTGSAGQAMGTITGGGSGSSLLGTAVSVGGNYLAGAAGFTGGIGTFGEFAGAASGAIPSGAIGTGAVAAGVGVDTAAAGVGSELAGVYAALAEIPVWGWIAMAVIAIGAWIAGNHKGGPKVGGSAFGSVDSGGNFVDAGAVPGTDNGRLFTPDQMDSGLQKLVAATALTTAATITALGGKSGGFNFALGADNDPNGTAQSRVSAMLTDALGHIIYSNLDQNMDDKAVPQALQLETERMMVAAIKASSDTLDPAIAAVFKDLDPLTASLQDLDTAVKKALEIKAVIDALGQLNAKGLDITALQAWQRQGETISQTFQRVAAQFAQFDDAFSTEAQKLDAAQKTVDEVFGKLGLAVPSDAKALYDLVHGLDLSTKAGRDAFDAIMSVGGALQNIEQAALAAVQAFNEAASRLNPSYGGAVAGQNLDSAAQAWINFIHSGETPDQVIANLAGNIGNAAWLQNALKFAQGFGTNGVNLLTALLNAFGATSGGGSGVHGPSTTTGGGILPGGDFSGALGGAADAAKQLAEALKQAKMGLGDYVDSLMTNKSLSPLSPAEQEAAAQAKFEADLKAAQGGDLAAFARLQGEANDYLGLARGNRGSSSSYVDIFKHVVDSLGALSGTGDYNTRMLAIQSSQVDALKEIKGILINIRDGGSIFVAPASRAEAAVERR